MELTDLRDRITQSYFHRWDELSSLEWNHLLESSCLFLEYGGASFERLERFPSESKSHSVMSDSLQPHGLYTPWNSPSHNTGVGTFPSPGDLPNPGIEPRSPKLQVDSLPAEPPGKPWWGISQIHHKMTYPLSSVVWWCFCVPGWKYHSSVSSPTHSLCKLLFFLIYRVIPLIL